MRWKQRESGVENIYYWTLEDWLRTEFDFEELEVDLVSEKSDDLSQFDFVFIEETLSKLDYYFDKGISYIQTRLREEPALFQLTDEELEQARKSAAENDYYHVPDNNVEKYTAVAIHEFPVNQPNIVFYPDNTWLMRFAEADFPSVNYGYGIALFFDQAGKITEFDILAE